MRPDGRMSLIVRFRCPAVVVSAVTTVLLANVLLATALAPPAAAVDAKPPGTTTTSSTTTTLPVPTTPAHGPGGPNPTSTGSTTTTTTPAPTTTVPPQVVSALVSGVQDDLAQLDAIAGYDQDKGIVTVSQLNAASADSDADLAAEAETQAANAFSSAQAAFAEAKRELSALAIALYVRSDVESAQPEDASADATVDRDVMLGILINHGESELDSDRRQVKNDMSQLLAAEQRAANARAAQALAHVTLTKSDVALANAKLAAAGRAVTVTTGTPFTTILGPTALSAGELAGWYATTGYQANTTVPMATLAGYYLTSATAAGLRGDIAFAQSIVETGYFTFPTGGQVDGTDNNFAGIGACDSCAHGWTFPSAQTGVAAQIQLLDAYASPQKIPTPLVGNVGVAGCCPTWLSLGGVWATAIDYGYEILNVYKEILDWAIPERLAAAGL